MSKDHQRKLIKLIEKFRKVADKEKEKQQDFADKASKLAAAHDGNPLASHFVDRLKQKAQQLSDDIAWAKLTLDETKNEPDRVVKNEKAKDK